MMGLEQWLTSPPSQTKLHPPYDGLPAAEQPLVGGAGCALPRLIRSAAPRLIRSAARAVPCGTHTGPAMRRLPEIRVGTRQGLPGVWGQLVLEPVAGPITCLEGPGTSSVCRDAGGITGDCIFFCECVNV